MYLNGKQARNAGVQRDWIILPLVPAKAGTQFLAKRWIPAFAGMSGEYLDAGGSKL